MKPLLQAARSEYPSLSITALCAGVGFSRASFYRLARFEPASGAAGAGCTEASTAAQADMALRHRIQAIALEFGAYGYRRIRAQLHREGLVVNHKRVLRLMRQDNLLCLRKRRFVLGTTDSAHGLPVYPNLASSLRLTGLNQLWVADITYVRLGSAFVYLAVILDAYSRRVIGWALSDQLDAGLVVEALQRALALRGANGVPPGLVHHSDRGVQYASREYVGLLEAAGIQISMSRRGNPYDNAQAESFMKTLKYEEVYLQEYDGIEHARACIGHFLEEVYNQKRLHSALAYQPPAEFEDALLARILNHTP